MRRLFRSLVALTASGMLLIGPQQGATPSLAQPRTPCDQLGARLIEIWDREDQLRADLEGSDLVSVLDRLEGVLVDTDALLQRLDECSRSPVPSFAD